MIVYTLNPLLPTLDGEVVYKKNTKLFNSLLDGPVDTVQIGMDKEPICVPGNAMLTVPGNTSRIEKGSIIYSGASSAPQFTTWHQWWIAACVTPKVRRVPVILINTTDQNIWVRQPLLATELFEGEPQQYHTEFNHKGGEIVISFLPAPPHEDQEQVEDNAVEVEEKPEPPKKDSLPVEHPKIGERPDTVKAYDFKKMEWLPFQFNLGDAFFTKEQ